MEQQKRALGEVKENPTTSCTQKLPFATATSLGVPGQPQLQAAPRITIAVSNREAGEKPDNANSPSVAHLHHCGHAPHLIPWLRVREEQM